MRKARGLLIAPFDEAHATVRTTIHQALKDIEVEVFHFEHIAPGAILAKAISDAIRASDFLVADISSANPNVFYELGTAHAFRKPTILLVKLEEGMKIPYDVIGFSYIFYEPNNLNRLANDVKEYASRIIARKQQLLLATSGAEHV